MRFLCSPTRVSPLRTVISIADRMPGARQAFYETGPAYGIARVARYSRTRSPPALLAIEDCELAAAQFLDSCQSTTFKPLMFNAAGLAHREAHRLRGEKGGEDLSCRLPALTDQARFFSLSIEASAAAG